MPDLPECTKSPFARSERFRGAAMITGHKRYCDLIDPEHPDYDPRIAAAYVDMSLQLAGGKGKGKGAPVAPGNPVNWPGGPPEPEGGNRPAVRPDVPPRAAPVLATLDDANEHEATYKAATSCPHRVESKSCCTPDRCGPEGVQAGKRIDIGVCYACQAARLGFRTG